MIFLIICTYHSAAFIALNLEFNILLYNTSYNITDASIIALLSLYAIIFSINNAFVNFKNLFSSISLAFHHATNNCLYFINLLSLSQVSLITETISFVIVASFCFC